MAIKKGTTANDNLTGTAALDRIFGDGGNDTIGGGNGNDWLFGGDANDSILGGNDHDRLGGGLGVDTLLGGAGNDFISGGDSFSSFRGDFVGDRLDGGAGDDEFEVAVNDTVIGGAGRDFFHFSSFNLMPEVYTVNLANIGGPAARAIGAAGTALENTFVGQMEGADVFLDALAGSVIFGSNGNDSLGVSIRRPDDRAAREDGPGGTIAGGNGHDELRGSDFNDTLTGGAGDDIIDGGFAGADGMAGGAGADLFQFELRSVAPETDLIKDFSAIADLLLFTAPRGGIDDINFGSQSSLLLKTIDPVDAATTPAGIAQFIYNTRNGRLYVDVNGQGDDGLQLLMLLAGKPNISAANILVEYVDGLIF